MSDKPRRRFLDRMAPSPSLIAAGTRIVGDIETAGPLIVSGMISGNGRIDGELSIAPEAHWRGDLSARSAMVAGHITGSILVSEKIEIAATARILGRVSARMIAMARGARIDGDITVTGSEPVVEFEERRG